MREDPGQRRGAGEGSFVGSPCLGPIHLNELMVLRCVPLYHFLPLGLRSLPFCARAGLSYSHHIRCGRAQHEEEAPTLAHRLQG